MMFMLLFLAFWCYFVGSVFGSFLNVVVWRLPQGMNLSFPLSHCPKCRKPIRRRHNVPVLGWLMLWGKCYDCGQPISKRYPIVEFICGCAALLIFWGISPEIMMSLVAMAAPDPSETADIILALTLVSAMADMALFLTILAAGLIVLDGNRVPWKIFAPFWILWLIAWGGWIAFRGFPPLPVIRPLGVNFLPLALPAVVGCMLFCWRLYPRNRGAMVACLLGTLATGFGLCAVTLNVTLLVMIVVTILRHRSNAALAVPVFSLLSVTVLKSVAMFFYYMAIIG